MESDSAGLHRDASQLLIVTAVHVAELVRERGEEKEKRNGEEEGRRGRDILRRMEREREEVRA